MGSRSEDRSLLHNARGGPGPRHQLAKEDDGDAAHGRAHHRAGGAPLRAGQQVLELPASCPLPVVDLGGMLVRVVPKEQIEEATLELAKKIVSYSSSVIGLGKKAFYQQMAQPDISQVSTFPCSLEGRKKRAPA